MWGNRLGWGISAAMVLVVVGAWLIVENMLQITPPTSFSSAENLAALSPPQPTQPIVQFDEPGNAGQVYRQAASGFADASDACETYARKPQDDPPQPIQFVLNATQQQGTVVFGDDPGQIVNYDGSHPNLDALNDLGHLMDSAAVMFKKQKKIADAQRFFRAVYSLGLRLYNERLNYEEYATGMRLMNEATAGLAECEPDNAAVAGDLQEQESAVSAYDQNHVTPIYQVLVSADQERIAANAGDIFVFATQAKERMFQVEAILKLGRYRYDSARNADQLAAPRFLRRLSADPDPVIRTAATAAASLTIEQYRMIH